MQQENKRGADLSATSSTTPGSQGSDAPARKPLTLDERIAAIEAALPQQNIAGTKLARCLAETKGLQWVLALGPLDLPKTFFYGPTIEDVVSQGEKAVAEMKAQGRTKLLTDWDRLDVRLTAEAHQVDALAAAGVITVSRPAAGKRTTKKASGNG